MMDSDYFFLQAHAASAVLNFSENCTPDILTPYLDGIVSKLLVLLQVKLLKGMNNIYKQNNIAYNLSNSYLLFIRHLISFTNCS